MIRKAVLKARAAHGYAWLTEVGPYYGLDVNRLHLRPELIDVGDPDWCPLAHSDTQPAPLADHFDVVCDRLTFGVQIPGTGKQRRIYDIDTFLVEHGFDIDDGATWRDGRHYFGTWGFAPGSNRDWRLLTEAWREVVAANKFTQVPQASSR